MSTLENAQQVELISEYIKAAKINKAHIGIARLEKNEIIDTILTTNFDPLASRACALFNQFPAIYDLANLGDKIEFDFSYVSGSAIFHLHGQHTGFRQFNDKAKLEAQAARIQPVLQAVMKGKPIIIAGYSGEKDPLIDEIVKLAPFNHGLYWICHDDKNPAKNVCDKLLSLDGCHIVRNMKADKFFDELAYALNLPQPEFLDNPFGHMLGVLDTLKRADEKDVDNVLLDNAKDQLNSAKKNQKPQNNKIVELVMEGKFEEVLKQFGADTSLDEYSKNLVAWSAVEIGNSLASQAQTKIGAEANNLFIEASKKYAIALKIKPQYNEVLYNWGTALLKQAQTKQGSEADNLFIEAGKKFSKALLIKPEDHEALYIWGLTLLSQAQTKQGSEEGDLLIEAGKKFAEALTLRPDKHETLYIWGVALAMQARTKQGSEAYDLFAEAGKKYAAALKIEPVFHEALNNWGLALLGQAQTKQGAEADNLFIEAGMKYDAALAIKPDFHKTLFSWGLALAVQAQTKQGAEADNLFTEAGKKYAAAIVIKPDLNVALHNWGRALINQAKTKQGIEADKLLTKALDKLKQAESLKPGSAAYDIACICGLRDDTFEAAYWLKIAKDKNINCPDCDHILKDTDFDLVRNTSEFKQALIDIGCG
jgi:cytochrome c-type biogenesis protein CcmH/NrfG